MKRNKNLNLFGLALIVLFISAVGMLAAPVSASTTTYTGTGIPRPILERANNATSVPITATANDTAVTLGIPPNGWSGYQMGTTFTNIARNADFVPNGQFTGTPNPWLFSKSGDTSYLSPNYNLSTSGSTGGSGYIRLQGKETVQRPLSNSNFTSNINNWNPSYSTSGYIATPTINWQSANGGEAREYATYNNGAGYTRTGYGYLYLDQNFTYSGSGLPDFASLNYRFYISNWQQMSSGSMTVKLVLTRGGTSFDIFSYSASGTTTKPPSITSVDITSYLTTPGSYRIRLYAYIYLSTPAYSQSIASVSWDDVGVYVRYGKFSSSSQAMYQQTFSFNQYAIADGKVTFKYYTNLTTIVPSVDSYISVWVNGTTSNNLYNILPFSSVTVRSWGTLSVPIPYNVLNQSTPLLTISLGIGVDIGTNLQINSSVNPRFYFDNVTFYIKYKPTPAFINLGIYDDANHQRWNDTETTYGSGTLSIKPTLPRAAQWTTSSVTFHAVFSGNSGIAGYNLTSTTFSLAPTLFSSRSTQTDYSIFTVHDDTRTTWYLNYSTPSYLGGCQNYNASIYVPADWLSGGLVNQIKFGGLIVTNYQAVQVNSSTWLIKIPASVFAPNPPRFLLEISTFSPNYLGPSSSRVLLFTQGNTTTNPGPSDWRNGTSFIPKNMTRLAAYIRDGSGGIPSNVASFSATVRLYNASSGKPLSVNWNVYPNSNGFLTVTLNPWADKNVTWWDGIKQRATSWYFYVNWTNNYEAANGIASFTTNSTLSVLIPTTLTCPGQPYTATYFRGFTMLVNYRDARDGSYVGTIPNPATVTYRWNGTADGGSMSRVSGSNGSYVSSQISGSYAYQNHYAPQGTWIQINASKTGYVPQSIMVRVFVRDEFTSGSAPPFPVPYASYPWNSTIMASLTYLDSDNGSTGIYGASLKLNSTWGNYTRVGSSGMVWWYRDLKNGSYRIFIRGNATSIGNSIWSFTVTANKTHYSSITFGLNGFNIRDRLTTYTYSSLSLTTPWNRSAIVMITFRDLDAAGTPPIYGATPICTWRNGILNKDYFVTQLGNGTFQFILNVTGLNAPVTYFGSFGFSKTHWVTITGISTQVTVRKINTILSSPETQINTFWGDNATTVLTYLDLDNTLTISFASWDSVQVYNVQTGSDFSSMFASLYNIYFNSTANSWMIRINGSLPKGNYNLWIHAYVNPVHGFYVDQWFYPTLNVKDISTNSVMKVGTVLTVVWSDFGKIILNYTDTAHKRPVLGANVVLTIDSRVAWSWYENGSGVYTVFLNGTAPLGPWPFMVQISELHYASSSIPGNLTIRSISTSLTVPTQIFVAYGDSLTFSVFFKDLNHTKGIYATGLPLTLDCNWTISGSLGDNYDQSFNNGTYLFGLDSTLKGQGIFLIEVEALMTPYYAPAVNYFTITIGIVNTSYTPPASSETPWGNNANVTLGYYRKGTTNPITDVEMNTTWTPAHGYPGYTYYYTGTQWLISFITTGLPEGTYWANVTILKQHYQNQTLTIPVTIRVRHVELQITHSPPQVQQGSIANITILLSDLDNSSRGVTGASLSISGGGLSSSSYVIKELGGGYYEVDVNTGSIPPGKLSFTINMSRTHYLVTLGSGQVSFDILTAPGLSLPTVIMIGGGSGGLVVFVILGYIMYRRRKIPFVVKKIDQSINLINKGEMPQPVPMKTRTQAIGSIYQAKLAILSKEKLEEPKKKEMKGAKKPEGAPQMKSGEALAPIREQASTKKAPEAEVRIPEAETGAEPAEADVALIAEELEKLETKGGTELIRETDLIKREMEEMEKEAKKKKKKGN